MAVRVVQNYDFAFNVGTSLCDVRLIDRYYVNVPKARPYIMEVLQVLCKEEGYP